MTIGERIKALRKKNDLTQEKLADYLCVSYQAVSKWECGLSSPDLSLIGPLTKLLHVSADELLGLTPEIADARKAYFDAEFHEFWKKDHEEDLEIARQAVAEYPGDFRYLHWLASNEWYVGYSVKYMGTKKEKELLESSLHHHLVILENCNDPYLRNEAISGLVYVYKSLNKIDEAKKYALMYPEAPETSRESLLTVCLKGDELTALLQQAIKKCLRELSGALYKMWYNNEDERYVKKALEAEEAILRIIIDDNNFGGFNHDMSSISMNRAELAVADNNYEEAIDQLAKAKQYAIDYDKVVDNKKGNFTCLLLEKCPDDYTNSRVETSCLDYWKLEMLENKVFSVLQEKADFQELLNN